MKKELKILIKAVKIHNDETGMEFGILKRAMQIMKNREKINNGRNMTAISNKTERRQPDLVYKKKENLLNSGLCRFSGSQGKTEGKRKSNR